MKYIEACFNDYDNYSYIGVFKKEGVLVDNIFLVYDKNGKIEKTYTKEDYKEFEINEGVVSFYLYDNWYERESLKLVFIPYSEELFLLLGKVVDLDSHSSLVWKLLETYPFNMGLINEFIQLAEKIKSL